MNILKFKIMRKLSLFLLLSIFTASIYSQEKTYYSSNYLDIAKYGSWAKSTEYPVKANVKIIQTSTNFTVYLGEKKFVYTINSKKQISAPVTLYYVSMRNKKYELKIDKLFDPMAIGVEGVWMTEIERIE